METSRNSTVPPWLSRPVASATNNPKARRSLNGLEGIRRLRLRAEGVHAVSWLWHNNIYIIVGDTAGSTQERHYFAAAEGDGAGPQAQNQNACVLLNRRCSGGWWGDVRPFCSSWGLLAFGGTACFHYPSTTSFCDAGIKPLLSLSMHLFRGCSAAWPCRLVAPRRQEATPQVLRGSTYTCGAPRKVFSGLFFSPGDGILGCIFPQDERRRSAALGVPRRRYRHWFSSLPSRR